MKIYLFHYVFSLALTCISCLILGTFVYLKNRKSKVNKSFFLLSLSMAIWSGFQTGIGSTNYKWVTMVTMYPEHIGIVFIPSFFLNFIYNLLEIRKKTLLKVGYLLSFLFLTLLPTGLFLKGVDDYHKHVLLKSTIEPGSLYILFLAFFIFYMAMGAFELLKAYIHSRGARRNQMKYFLWAVVLAIVMGSSNYIYLFDVKVPLWFPLATYGVPLYALATSYAIVRYRLMDISVVIKRTVTYGIIYSFSVAVFAVLTVFFGQWLLYGRVDRRFYWLSLLSILIITLLLRPLDNLLTRLSDRYLFRKKYEYQKTLKEASRGMTRIKSLPKLLDLIVRMIVTSVRVTHATIFLLDKERPIYVAVASRGRYKVPKGFVRSNASSRLVLWLLKKKEALVYDEIISQLKREPDLKNNLRISLESITKEMQDLNASVCIPSFMENKMIGFLMLGEKLSGDMYTQEDLDLFLTLTNQAALAIENAQSYEELKDTRDQLLRSERLATIGKFANEVAHEIKNPLQAIKTFVEYLPQKYNDKDFREKFTKIAGTEIERMDSFVKQLVGFSKPKPLEFSPVEINQLLDTTLLLLENEFKKKNALIKRGYLKKDMRLLADRNQLKQVFLDLFLNSLEAMDETKPNQLIVETLTNNNCLIVKITDTGCGISSKDLPHLFEPFFTTKQNGAGLGLTIVKSIIENHNGKISVESKLGKGASFCISFPYLNKK